MTSLRKTHLISIADNWVNIPTGLLVEKWLLYYYPILESHIIIQQISGEANLSFGNQLKKLISFYELRGGFSAFYNDLKMKVFTEEEFKKVNIFLGLNIKYARMKKGLSQLDL